MALGSQTTITPADAVDAGAYRRFFFRGGCLDTGSGTNRAFNNPRGSSPAPGRVPANMA